jgi:putative spermidine/putrescine transport system permease protein
MTQVAAGPTSPSRRRGVQSRRAARQRAFRAVVVTLLAVFFLLPLFAMLEFTTRGPGDTRTLDTWRTVVDVGLIRADYPELWAGVKASAALVVLTVALMLLILVPTMTWVRLRLPRWHRAVEFTCLLPLTIPAIVLVVGLAPVYAWVTYFLGESSALLFFAYTVLVLPYCYRALDAGLSSIDVRTLSEAARSLGASWVTVMLRVILPNIRTAVLSASFLAVALVLGEFTIASLLNRDNLQVGINLLGKRDAKMSVAVSLAALVVAFVLLLVLSLAGGRRRRASAPADALEALPPGTDAVSGTPVAPVSAPGTGSR